MSMLGRWKMWTVKKLGCECKYLDSVDKEEGKCGCGKGCNKGWKIVFCSQGAIYN